MYERINIDRITDERIYNYEICNKNDIFDIANKRALQSLPQMVKARNEEPNGEH